MEAVTAQIPQYAEGKIKGGTQWGLHGIRFGLIW